MSEQPLESNPYVGLRPFFAEDSLYFYGREQQTEELLEILRHHHFLGVVGSSGSGKSSLVRAGLLPALLGGFLVQDRDQWSIVQIKPGDEPIGNLCTGISDSLNSQATAEDHAHFEQNVRDGHTGAVIDFLRTELDDNANLFVLVDQFEEIFAFRGVDADNNPADLDLPRRAERARRKAEAADYVSLLLELAKQRDLPIYLALTMRTDFLGDCDSFHGLPDALNQGRYLVPRLTRSQLRDAVECPALLLGTEVAPRLLDHVCNELGDRFDRLPVLQHALLRAWDDWERLGDIGAIDLQHFKSAGGLSGSLALDAEAALDGLDIDITARVFKRLTDTDLSRRRVRSPARITELMEAANTDWETVDNILRHFEKDGRNFVNRSADGKPDDPRVDISHESLIRQWDRLRDWVDEERRSRNRYQELVIRADRYAQGDVPLLQSPELEIAVRWRASTVPTSGWARRYSHSENAFRNAQRYLDESLAAHQKQLDAHNTDLAEQEVSNRWQKILHPLLGIEILIGVWLSSGRGPATYLQGGDLIAVTGEYYDELFKLIHGGIKGEHSAIDMLFEPLLLSWHLILNPNFIMILVFWGACITGNRHATYLYRTSRLPRVLQAVESGTAQIQLVADELPDAREATEISYATWGQRARCWFKDAIRQGMTAGVVFALGIVVMVIIQSLLGSSAEEVTDGELVAVIIAIVIVNWWRAVSPIVSETMATKSMQAAGIYRVGRFGERLTYARATLWYFARFLSVGYFWLGFLIQPFTPKRQTFHDWVARTVVLQYVQIIETESAPDSTEPDDNQP